MSLSSQKALFLIDEGYWLSLPEFQQEYLILHHLGTSGINQTVTNNLLDLTNPQSPLENDWHNLKNQMLNNLFL